MRFHKTSGRIACDRLKQLLIFDKIQAAPDTTLQMKRELHRVIAKYINTEQMQIEIQLRLTDKTKQGEKHVKTIQIKGL